jgi:hypothetical protein
VTRMLAEGKELIAQNADQPFVPGDQLQPYSGVNTMAGKTSKKSAKVAKKAAAKRVAAKAAKPRKTAPKLQSRKVAKPALLAGGNPQIAKAVISPQAHESRGKRNCRRTMQCPRPTATAPCRPGLTSCPNCKLPTLAASMPSRGRYTRNRDETQCDKLVRHRRP